MTDMHVIDGGTYKDVAYSCMYDANTKYDDVSKNEKIYYMWGIVDNTEKEAILAFSVETDELIYAAPLSLPSVWNDLSEADQLKYWKESIFAVEMLLTKNNIK